MQYNEIVEKLAELYGILHDFYDISGRHFVADFETKKKLLQTMKIDVSSSEKASLSLECYEEKLNQKILQPVYVFFSGEEILIPAVFSRYSGENYSFTVFQENGEIKKISAGVKEVYPQKIYQIESAVRVFSLNGWDQTEGYHKIELVAEDSGEHIATSELILCPKKCYAGEQDKKLKGLAVQIYALNSEANSGIGDLGDLQLLSGYAAEMKLDLIGVSPLHALFSGNRLHISPYSPSSRIFFNTNHLSLQAVQEWDEASEIIYLENKNLIEKEKEKSEIDYGRILAVKHHLLRNLFEIFYSNEYLRETARKKDFDSFCSEQGEALELHALYESLYEKFAEEGRFGFTNWPESFQNPEGKEAAQFKKDNEKEILFFKYGQWIFSEQLKQTVKLCRKKNIGLYLDLAVGSVCDGSEVWSRKDLFAQDVSIGAPPDPFSPTGQKWGLCPPIPFRMAEESFQSFRMLLNANMTQGGMIRLDHAMALNRTYWVLDEKGNGSYVRYPFRELTGILALESNRKQCMVIGEDLGTVPEGFREEMLERNIFSWKVLYFEKGDDGSFKDPGSFPFLSIATVNTHDLPTVFGYLKSEDIFLRKRLGIFNEEKTQEELHSRERDIENLLLLLKKEGYSDLSKDDPTRMIDALHSLLSRSGSSMVLYSLHDILYDARQPNLPGTVNEYPNWSLRYPASIESFPRIIV
ncbi:MAG: 4-alpha-glucanotransferase [Spirochaetia bacterium]|nr:4-alpha-glucanotransferase [Spirochaetia bacterium]